MKRCSSCHKMLDETKFHSNKNTKSGLHNQCKDCRKRYSKEHKEEIKLYAYCHRTDIRERDRYYRHLKLNYISTYKTECIKCGKSDKSLICFHHIEPKNKKFTIGKGIRKNIDEIKKEIDKCVCLCSDCHREFHHLYGYKPEHAREKLEDFAGIKLKKERTKEMNEDERFVEGDGYLYDRERNIVFHELTEEEGDA